MGFVRFSGSWVLCKKKARQTNAYSAFHISYIKKEGKSKRTKTGILPRRFLVKSFHTRQFRSSIILNFKKKKKRHRQPPIHGIWDTHKCQYLYAKASMLADALSWQQIHKNSTDNLLLMLFCLRSFFTCVGKMSNAQISVKCLTVKN